METILNSKLPTAAGKVPNEALLARPTFEGAFPMNV
jgi:hypothetical protein